MSVYLILFNNDGVALRQAGGVSLVLPVVIAPVGASYLELAGTPRHGECFYLDTPYYVYIDHHSWNNYDKGLLSGSTAHG